MYPSLNLDSVKYASQNPQLDVSHYYLDKIPAPSPNTFEMVSYICISIVAVSAFTMLGFYTNFKL